MNYYERYCGDYQRDMVHLSLVEHGTYTMLLDNYFSDSAPVASTRIIRLAYPGWQQRTTTSTGTKARFPSSSATSKRLGRCGWEVRIGPTWN